jgi:tungstate transport system substrate-binding protein
MKKRISGLDYLVIFLVMILSAACTPAATLVPTEKPEQIIAPTSEALATTIPDPTVIPATEAASDPVNPEIILATTTSTRDSGLLDELLPLFEEATGYKVKMVAVGTGQALQMGQEGNADVLLVHAPKSEKDFMDGGFGKDRFLVMHNDFIVVGPAEDPAKITGSATTIDAFKSIAATKAIFVSRGDDSGTNKAELNLWKAAEITPEGDWYLKTGQGMGDTLRIASEKAGYTLTDRATFLSMKDTLNLAIVCEGDKALLNIYHVITVNPDKWPNMNYEGAKAFADWLVSAETQKIIGEFGAEKYGQALFTPDAGKAEDEVK